MKILVCTGVYPPDIGGPAKYAKNLGEEFLRCGHNVKVLAYGLEKKLPTGIRHCFYFFRVVLNIRKTDLIIALDTYSVGLPAVCVSKIFGKKIIIRTGGDFLWESYVEKTGDLITLNNFYQKKPNFTLKQKIIFLFQKFTIKNCAALVFSADWQKEIWQKAYNLNPEKLFIIENFYGEKLAGNEPKEQNFLWAGRRIKLKNIDMLKSAFDEAKKENSAIKLEIKEKIPYDELMKEIQNCYAIILPSLSEISPNFILDAIKFNKPFILTRETGFRERMKDIGIFINPLDKEDIKNKILFLAKEENYSDYKNRIANFNFTHSWQEIADEFLSIYKKL